MVSFADEMSLAFTSNRRQSWMEKLTLAIRRILSARMPSALKTRELKVEERLSIGPKKSLLIVYCRGERFLVASGAENISSVLPLSPSKSRRGVKRLARRTR
jgi:flagellar biogenesis protein FliO